MGHVLLFEWDSIGVSSSPEAQTDCRGYIRGVYDVAVKSRSALAVAKYLAGIERDSMRLSGRAPDQLLPVAETILELVADSPPLPWYPMPNTAPEPRAEERFRLVFAGGKLLREGYAEVVYRVAIWSSEGGFGVNPWLFTLGAV